MVFALRIFCIFSHHNLATILTNFFAFIKTNIKSRKAIKLLKRETIKTALWGRTLHFLRSPTCLKKTDYLLLEKSSLSFFYKNEYVLYRPFLSLTRFDLKKICTSWKIPLIPDQSNQKLKYQRNRIRKQILPALRFFFNLQIDTTIYQFIEIINSEQKYMDFMTARIVNEIQCRKKMKYELETLFINLLPLPIRRKIIKIFLEKLFKKSLRFFDVEQFLQQISQSKNEQKSFEKKINLLFLIKKIETKSILQKDLRVDIINKKRGKCKLYKLLFFPKTGSFFLQSQRVFFIKKLSIWY